MISEKMVAALSNQINLEYRAAYSYLAMSSYFLSRNFKGFANWMRVQAQEELVHGTKIFDFVDERDAQVQFADIQTPPQTWDNPLSVFENALANERKVSESIYDLVDLSLSERDHATNTFLQWFVSEQVEEEATIKEVIDNLKLVGNDGNGLFLLDRDLGQRTLAGTESEGGASSGA